MDRILDLEPRRILELGVGNGPLLARLAPRCEEYWGTDLSAEGIEVLRRGVEQQPELRDRVHLRAQGADVTDGLPQDDPPTRSCSTPWSSTSNRPRP
ncbi:hypothetical protein SBADM41S_10294 [Streptomyces badius]